jgi:membrane associated rhomboid family serine protease
VITFAYSSSISVGGHLGGLVAGILVMIGFLRFRRSPQACLGVAAVVAAASLVVAYSAF